MSLGLLVPFAAGAFPERAISALTDAAAPPKHVLFSDGGVRTAVATHSATVEGLLRERGITFGPGDRISQPLESRLADGQSLGYRAAVPVAVTVDGATRTIRTAAADVAGALAQAGVTLGSHDRVNPQPGTPLAADLAIKLTRVTSWLEHVRSTIPAPVTNKYDLGMPAGTSRVIDPGSAGTKETTIEVLQPNPTIAARRLNLAERVVRFPRAKVVAQGVGDYTALTSLARRGIAGTNRLADAALRMIATAYTPACAGCSGITATGRPAGHGIVAVDPAYIRLGTHLYIPGYGHALAGDTGSAIRGNRIDLGFESNRDALRFGRRPIVVYVFDKP